ncbi:MAG: hypothetical protein D3924_08525 [Candidatus Electrothrix sp. AR4]|nr:hypothetical protein [Candidatus Electrothrix sp. AR4]
MRFTKTYAAYITFFLFFFFATLAPDLSCSVYASTALTNTLPVSVSLSRGEEKFYSIEVPENVIELEVTLSGGTGDLDLYTRYSTPPSTSSYDCRPYLDGNNETCTHSAPADGIWYVMVQGYLAGSTTLTATYTTPTSLLNGEAVSLSLSAGEENFYSMQVPADTGMLKVRLAGGTGDLDLYTRYSIPPSTSSYDCRPYLDGNNETCTHSVPADGTWYVMVRGYLAGNTTLTATLCSDTCPDDPIFVDQQLSDTCFGTYSVSNRDCSGSEGYAYPTINGAIQSMENGVGGTIDIRGGIYTEAVDINRSGKQDNYLVIKAHTGETPIIDGGGSLPSTPYHDGLVSAAYRNYIHIQGLTIRNSRYMGFHAYHCDHIRITDCTVHNVQDGGICFDTGTDVLVDNCEVHHTNQEGPAAMHEAVTIRTVDTFEVKNTVVHNCEEEGIDAKYHATNGSIHDCLLYENNPDYPNLFIDKANNIDIYNNVLSSSGILLGIEGGGDTPTPFATHHISIYNNLISGSSVGVSFWVEDVGTYSDVLITNNLFYQNMSGIRSFAGEDHFGTDVVARNNIFWQNQDGAFTGNSGALSRMQIDHNLFDNTDSSEHGSNAITTEDVKFVNEFANDFKLESSSPAAGGASSQSVPSLDFDGTARTAPHDIGPYVVP